MSTDGSQLTLKKNRYSNIIGGQNLYFQFNGQELMTPTLRLYETTLVKIQAIYNQVQIFYNGTSVANQTLSSPRTSGSASLVSGDPSFNLATANLGPISITSLFVHPLQPNLVSQSTPQNVTVPANYTLTFNLTPLVISSGLTNILQYSADKSDFSRLPGVW